MVVHNNPDAEELKRLSNGKWPWIFQALANVPLEFCDGNHHPCILCGGHDRARAVDIEVGALFCNQCFREKNGDGIAALQWLLKISFPEALQLLADYHGYKIETKGRRKQKADPAKDLQFIEWVDAFAQIFCQNNPGICIEALHLAGAVMAYYYGKGPVIALPIYGEKLLDGGPVGWIVQDFQNTPLPKFDQSGKVVGHVKRKVTYGSSRGVVGDAAARALADPSNKIFYNLEGPPDYLTFMGCLLAEPRPGVAAFTTANGAGEDFRKLPFLLKRMENCEFRTIHDCDQPGQKGAEKKAAAMPETCTVKNYVLPYPIKETHGEDFRDWVNSDVSQPIATLEAAFEKIEASQAKHQTPFRNYIEVPFEDSIEIFPRDIKDITEEFLRRTGGWPKRIQGELFVDTGDAKRPIQRLKDASSLFAWGKRKISPFEWKDRKDGLVTRTEFHKDLTTQAECFDDYSPLPHEPSFPDIYYTEACKNLIAPTTTYARLSLLVDRFLHADAADRPLVKAYFVTLFWGGPSGRRPIFFVTSDGGVGSGKTKVCEAAQDLVGGSVLFGQTEPIDALKTRLLSEDGRRKRHVFLDNLKSNKFSSGELEGLITASEISGRALYVGNSSRPNRIVFGITGNGASLSRDLAERSVIIKVRKPEEYNPEWEQDTFDFLQQYRTEIINEILSLLKNKPTIKPRNGSRWPLWEREVLSRCCDSEAELMHALSKLRERRIDVDADSDELEQFESYVRCQLYELGYDIDCCRVFINSQRLCKWWNTLNNTNEKTNAVSRNLKQMTLQKNGESKLTHKPRKNEKGYVFESGSPHPNEEHTDLEDRIERHEFDRERRKRDVVRGSNFSF